MPKKQSTKEHVETIIGKIRPYIEMHGGGVELVSVESNKVKLRIYGTCKDCRLADLTYNNLIAGILREEVPGIQEVVLIK